MSLTTPESSSPADNNGGIDERRTPNVRLQQDPDIWIDDGNLIVTANDEKNATYGFKCHKSFLARHSGVFEGMFSLNQPANVDMYEGLPLVALPDTYADVKALLHMLYDPAK